MEETKETLFDWAYHYAKNRDLLTGTITKIEKRQQELFIIHKNKTQQYFILEHFSAENKERLYAIIKTLQQSKQEATKFFVIVVYNTKDDLSYLAKNWEQFVDFPNLTVIFANPNSKTDKRWMIQPYTHNKITEKSALESGLKSLADSVECIS